RKGLRRQSQCEHWSVGRIDLTVDRWIGKILGEQVCCSIDCGLHFLFGDINTEIERELKRDERTPARTGRGHLVQARYLSKLPLQRSRYRRCHHVGTCTRKERDHFNCRIVHLRQSRNRQLVIACHPRQKDGSHEQRGRNRPENENP